jgi:hypothetical protein
MWIHVMGERYRLHVTLRSSGGSPRRRVAAPALALPA